MDQSVEEALDVQGVTEVLVQLNDEAATSAEAGEGTERPILERFVPGVPTRQAPSAEAELEAGRDESLFPPEPLYLPILGVAVGYVDRDAASSIDRLAEVQAVYSATDPSLIRPIQSEAAEAVDELTWGLKALRITELWDRGLTGEGVGVAHLDTGVDARHPALRGKVAGWAQIDLAGGILPNKKPFDSEDHGTHTAATICGGTVDGLHVGVAPDARLYSAMVIEGGRGLRRVLRGLEWSLTQPVRVLSMSLGFQGFTPFLVGVMRRIREREVLPVVALGNEGALTSRSPGNYPESLSVGAVNKQRRVAKFSSSMRFERQEDPVQPDLTAPGVGVISAIPGGRLGAMSGTSMATPHVAGVAALLFQAADTATVDDVESALFDTCDPLRGVSSLRQGRGLVNPVRALEELERNLV